MRTTARRIYRGALGICARLAVHPAADPATAYDAGWEAGARVAFGYIADLDEHDPIVDARVHDLRRLRDEITELERVMGR